VYKENATTHTQYDDVQNTICMVLCVLLALYSSPPASTKDTRLATICLARLPYVPTAVISPALIARQDTEHDHQRIQHWNAVMRILRGRTLHGACSCRIRMRTEYQYNVYHYRPSYGRCNKLCYTKFASIVRPSVVVLNIYRRFRVGYDAPPFASVCDMQKKDVPQMRDLDIAHLRDVLHNGGNYANRDQEP
jgi:hypothetical protein